MKDFRFLIQSILRPMIFANPAAFMPVRWRRADRQDFSVLFIFLASIGTENV
jgi:hypothetical protein